MLEKAVWTFKKTNCYEKFQKNLTKIRKALEIKAQKCYNIYRRKREVPFCVLRGCNTQRFWRKNKKRNKKHEEKKVFDRAFWFDSGSFLGGVSRVQHRKNRVYGIVRAE